MEQGWSVFIADRDLPGARRFADDRNAKFPTRRLYCAECDTASWDSQLNAFKSALGVLGGRIDFVAPIAGIAERKWIPTLGSGPYGVEGEFVKPDLTVIDVDLAGVLYTVALALQQFRRQIPVQWSMSSRALRGKIALVASVCGFYCVPALPIYTAAKHGIIGLTRSYGNLLEHEDITVNAVAPNVVRTAISADSFYNEMEGQGLLTPMDGLLEAFTEIMYGETSGEVFECGPKGSYTKREGATYLDDESRRCCEMLQVRAKALHCEE